MEKQETRRNRFIGLQDNEKNLLDVINLHRNQNLDMDINDQEEDSVNEGEKEQQRTLSLVEYLKSNSCVILTNILNELKNSNPGKWSDKSIEDLFPTLLTNGASLLEETNVKELNIMCLELHCATGRNWASSNMVKAEIVNEIVKAFSGNNFVNVECRKKKLFNPESLVTLCVNSMKNNSFPKELIQIPLASLWQIEHRHEWFGRATVPLKCYVPTSMQGKIQTIDFFSYPEFCHTRNQLEFRTFDFTHVLTNLRTQILTQGLEYCKREHFEHLNIHKPRLLSLAFVFEKKQISRMHLQQCVCLIMTLNNTCVKITASTQLISFD